MGRTKQRLRNGEVTLGGWLMIGHPSVVELMASEGFDWIGVDMEHTSIDVRAFHELALAAKATGCDLLARLPSCDADLAKRVLDVGAAGIIVPSVNTPEVACRTVGMAKFPPDGFRGVSFSRAADFGRRFQENFQRHNEEVVVVVMLEHVDAVRNADAILATPGIDAALIGPYDLSASMGLAGQMRHPDVLAAQQTILNACRKARVPAGIHVVAVDSAAVRERIDQGFQFVACGIDTEFILAGCRAVTAGVRANA
jgi:2-dehydro-3-deoxyglucarate aldolase